jgi:nitroreductase
MSNRAVSNATLLAQLNWRYATKQFDPQRVIAVDDWKTLEQALLLAPSSFGLQPWKFLVVESPALRQQLVPHSWGQRQVVDASHLVVFAVKNELIPEDVDRLIQRTASLRGVPAESLEGYRQIVLGFIKDRPTRDWSIRQVYIALGQFMTAAALLGIDTCPMEGIDPAKYDEVLGLAGGDYSTAVVCPAGYRAETDKYATLPKVRYAASELIEHLR